MNEDNGTEQSEQSSGTAVKCRCTCQGVCRCGDGGYRQRRPRGAAQDIDIYVNQLNDWD